MRAVVQLVNHASVTVEGEVTGQISRGFLVFLGVAEGDTEKDLQYIIDKVVGLRVFEDEAGKMNLSVKDVGGAILAVSQFTLYGDCRHGKRPSFTQAAKPEEANALYERFVDGCRVAGVQVETGRFRTHMLVGLENDGPVTILLDSSKIL